MQRHLIAIFLCFCYNLLDKEVDMKTDYSKLWKLLIDKHLKKKDLQALAKLSSASIAKLTKNENVTTDILVKICSALECDISDIVEISN